jgi:ATP-dependent DNA helicase DinG
MISPASKKIIDACLTKISQHLPNFKQRPSQYQMITAVANNFSKATTISEENKQQGESILVVEGPTGTGKSLGYLLPAAVIAKEKEKKLVVSSATVMLQEQLANKDIPFFAKHTGLNISFAIAKGRGRYACIYRLKQQAGIASSGASQLEMELNSHLNENEKNSFVQMAQSFSEEKWSGDRDNLSKPVPDAIWSQITNDRHGCIKRDCPDYKVCPFFKAREELETVDVVIANHDLLLADMAMGGGVILPDPSETFYCIDEAHHLADKAIKQFAASHGINGSLAWLEKIEGALSKAYSLVRNFQHAKKITELSESLGSYLQDFRGALSGFSQLHLHSNEPALLRFKHGIIPEKLLSLCENLSTVSQSLLSLLNLLRDDLKLKKSSAEGAGAANLYDRALIDLGFYIGRVENLAAVWHLFSTKPSKNSPPIAKWITCEWIKNKNYAEQTEYTANVSPVSAASLLSTRLWEKIAGAVLTSATLRSLGNFDLLLNETGLNDFTKTTCLALDSPFDFSRQGKLIIPPMKSDPREPIAHTQELISLMPVYLPTTGGNGALVLFSSRKQMQEVASAMPASIKSLLLIQGEGSKEQLLKIHFKRIDENQPSILFGMASFAEGLDLAGNACNHLLIAKLPFAVPDDPVSETLADWLTQQGKNAFMEMSLPATSIKLIQSAGRLIRSETDTGTIIIFDTRLKTKPYGRLLLNSLPKFQQIQK